MMLPQAVLVAMVATPAGATPTESVDTAIVAPSPVLRAVPAELVADMAAPGQDPVPWNYTFEPWPPCSLG